ncbi:YqzE family protein [Paenibacillus sp. ACRSA]|uniref:YqzE family protein n=1 Tax=Paenibacillus sp. ACRSA TaxID=2918211 RepID=UPI001EF660AE|nr:YqzE family protein [Paenibacillus sp. ACRSA]MCG7377073.1 YqzE family protein [Paenibacillus sp. ACRSA]
MAKSDELVKYITQRVVHYIDTPKDERKGRTKQKEPWSMKWFGMIPFAVSLWVGKKGRSVESNARKRSSSDKE